MAEFTLEKRDHCLALTLGGDLTANAVPRLQAALREAITPDVSEVAVDLAQTAMLDSSGIGLLIATGNSLSRRGGTIRVTHASPDILQLLQSMRLTGRLNVSGRPA